MTYSEMDNPEELLDLVDATDQVIGPLERSEILGLEASGRGFARGSLVFLENPEGKLWIPIRSKDKKIAPGGYDSSVAEHVGRGEGYEAAALRGLVEETAISPEEAKLVYLGSVPPFTGLPYFHHVYKYPYDEVPKFSQDDYSNYEWLTPKELIEKLEAGAPAKEILLPAVRLLLQ